MRDQLRILAEAMIARAAAGQPPLPLTVQADHQPMVRDRLAQLGVPDDAIVFRSTAVEQAAADMSELLTPEERVKLALALEEAKRTDPYRMTRDAHATTDAMLNLYRHNDPAAAARIRAERKRGRE